MLINYVHVKIILYKIRIIRQILLTRTHTSIYQYFVDIVNKHPSSTQKFLILYVCKLKKIYVLELFPCSLWKLIHVSMVMYFHVNSRIKIKTPYQTCHQEHSPSRWYEQTQLASARVDYIRSLKVYADNLQPNIKSMVKLGCWLPRQSE